MSDSTTSATPQRTGLTSIAGPLFGEFVLGISVAMAGLWLASQEGDTAAGSFGLVQQILEALQVLFRIMVIGAGVVVTQALGSGNALSVRQTSLAMLGACTWLGLIAAAWLAFGGDITLRGLNAPVEVYPVAHQYMLFLAPVMVLEAYNLCMAAVLRAHLRAKQSLWVMVIMHVTHLALAWFFMRGVGAWDGFGIEGFAIGMLISRAIGLVLHLMLWRRGMQLVPRWQDWWRLRWAYLQPVLRIGIPGAGTEATYRIAFLVSLSATAKLGVAALATSSYTLQTMRYVLLASMAIGWAVEIMVGRLVGAGKFRDADALVRKGVRNGLVASGFFVLLAALSSPWLMQVFTRDPAVIHAATVLLWISVALELGRVSNLVVTGAIRAAGDVHYPVVIGVSSQLVFLGAGSYFLGAWIGLPGVWIAYAVDECVRGVLIWMRWRKLGWLHRARTTVRLLRSQQRRRTPEVRSD